MTGTQNRRMLIVIVVLTLLAAFVSLTSRVYNLKLFSLDTHPRYGLDIKGGVRVVLHPDVDQYNKTHPKAPWTPDKLERVKDIIEKRVNYTGVAEPLILTRPDTNQVVVELPGVRDPDEAIKQIQSTASLEFYLLPQLGNKDGSARATWTMDRLKDPQTGREDEVLVDKATGKPISTDQLEAQVFDPGSGLRIATGEDLLPNSRAVPDPVTNSPVIEFEFNQKGSHDFEEATRANIGRYLAIFLDKRLLTAPTINSVIPGRGIIEGNFTLESAKALSDQLNAGALPVNLQLQETRKLEATLGRESVTVTTWAGVVGLLLVLGCMLFWYRLPGVVANVALILYTLFSIAIFKLYPITLTLPGIAGFILSIGMAVDANILIFERFKEELNSGKSLRAAIDAGFRRAFTAILDSNICTAMTCAVLYNFGTGPIRGFALTLGLGVAISMFTAITVTRTLLFALVDLPFAQNRGLYALNSRHYDLKVMSRKWLWLGISGAIIVPGLIAWIAGGIKYSIDFQGGTELTIPYAQRHDGAEINRELSSLGARYRDSRVVLSEEPTAGIKHIATITTPKLSDTERLQVINVVTHNGADLPPGQTISTVPYANVSGTISSQLTWQAVEAVLISSILIVLFLTFRFSIGGLKEGLKYGTCAVIALLHDVLVVWGAFALLGLALKWQIDSLFVTAMLTVIGFSVHDTIIVFDRIRENMHNRSKGETFEQLVDRSIDQTISRSVKTSFTVVLVLLALFLFGSNVIHQFSAALLIGIISGTYSSIFNASVLLAMWKQHDTMPSLATGVGTSVSSRSRLTLPGDKPLVTAKPTVDRARIYSTPEDGVTNGSDSEELSNGASSRTVTSRRQPVRKRRM